MLPLPHRHHHHYHQKDRRERGRIEGKEKISRAIFFISVDTLILSNWMATGFRRHSWDFGTTENDFQFNISLLWNQTKSILWKKNKNESFESSWCKRYSDFAVSHIRQHRRRQCTQNDLVASWKLCVAVVITQAAVVMRSVVVVIQILGQRRRALNARYICHCFRAFFNPTNLKQNK